MKTLQMSLDESLLEDVDRTIRKLKTTRSRFIRQSLRAALMRLETLSMEKRHREGYRRKPVRKGEFDIFEREDG